MNPKIKTNEDSAWGPMMMFGTTGPGPKQDRKPIPSNPKKEKGIDIKNKKKMKNIKTFEEFVNESQLNEGKAKWTVVSQDAKSKMWGIEGDFDADDEDDAITLAQAQAIKHGAKRNMFYAFHVDSKELHDFMDKHDFID